MRSLIFLSHGGHCRMVAVKSSKVFVARLVPANFLRYHSRNKVNPPRNLTFILGVCDVSTREPFYLKKSNSKENRDIFASAIEISCLFFSPQSVSAHPRI